jgi:hypothetical protein
VSHAATARSRDRVVSDKCEPVSKFPGEASSTRKLTPLGKRSGAVLFEAFAGNEVAFEIEVIVGRGEFLKGLDVPEPRHRPFASAERLI